MIFWLGWWGGKGALRATYILHVKSSVAIVAGLLKEKQEKKSGWGGGAKKRPMHATSLHS